MMRRDQTAVHFPCKDPYRVQRDGDCKEELPGISMDYAEIGNDGEGSDAKTLFVGWLEHVVFYILLFRAVQGYWWSGGSSRRCGAFTRPATPRCCSTRTASGRIGNRDREQKQIITGRENKATPQNPQANGGRMCCA